jgi:undecaprenyl phosphate N,N'-diacetylbacillosamine 1-phosphate transferase
MNTLYKKYFKTIIDTTIAFIAIVLLFPVMLIISILIKLDSKGSVLFKQPRLGLKGSVFQIYKFRSMVSDQRSFTKTTKIFDNDPRITKIGRFIRKTSIDELPQLFNIIKGDMSFIGPRPPLPYFPKKYCDYTEFEKQRFMVKPGISGLAQTRCREIHDWEVNIPIDVEYTKKYGFIYDSGLFLKSLSFFFMTENVYRKK